MQDWARNVNSSSIIEKNVRNLVQSPTLHKLWLIDNERGLTGAYQFIYSPFGIKRKFLKFQLDMLRTMCIFDKKVVTNINSLANDTNPFHTLESYAVQREPLIQKLNSNLSKIFTEKFSERLEEIQNWIDTCSNHV